MDEEYRLIQSDLGFFQTNDVENNFNNKMLSAFDNNDDIEKYDDKMRYRELNINRKVLQNDRRNQKICVPIEYGEENCNTNDIRQDSSDIAIDDDDEDEDDEDVSIKTGTIMTTQQQSSPTTPTDLELNQKSSSNNKQTSDNINNKNEVIFKSIFDATKNAFFRTAQSIIDNHEKKNSKKDKDFKSPTEITTKKNFFNKNKITTNNNTTVTLTSPDATTAPTPTTLTPSLDSEISLKSLSKSSSTNSLNRGDKKVPGIAHCFYKEVSPPQIKTEYGQSGLLRFFESPVFNIHFAVHYLFYSKEPGVLSFIGNKIFSFSDNDVDLYIPQLILMYIQMDELSDILDPYLVCRCRKSADFSLKCAWLLEAYNYNMEGYCNSNSLNKKNNLNVLRELYPKRERKQMRNEIHELSPIKKTHHRSQSDATGLLGSLHLSTPLHHTPIRLCLGDLGTGRAFDNGCLCFDSVRGTVNGLLGHQTVCSCGVSLFIIYNFLSIL